MKSEDRDTLQRLVNRYCDGSADPKLGRLAREAAEARMFLDKVEHARAKQLDRLTENIVTQENMGDLSTLVADEYSSIAIFLKKLSRYERAAQAKWRKAVRALEQYEATKSANL